MAASEGIATDGTGGKGEGLPGVAEVVETVAIGAVAVFPGFAPSNGRKNENERDGGGKHLRGKIANGALFGHVGGGAVVIETVGPIDESKGAEMKFGGVEVARRGIDAKSVSVACGGYALGGANRGRIKHQLREKGGSSACC